MRINKTILVATLLSLSTMAQAALPLCCISGNIVYDVEERMSERREPGDIMGGPAGAIANIAHLIPPYTRSEAAWNFARTCELELSDRIDYYRFNFFGRRTVQGTVSEALAHYYDLADRNNGAWGTVIPKIPHCSDLRRR